MVNDKNFVVDYNFIMRSVCFEEDLFDNCRTACGGLLDRLWKSERGNFRGSYAKLIKLFIVFKLRL